MKRRTALGALGVAPFLTANFGSRALAQGGLLDLDPANPYHNLMIFRKLAHTMDDTLAYFWADLRRLGQVGTTMTHMWDIKLAAVLSARDVDETGTYETTAISMVAYTHPETGEVLETYDNPWTGQTVDISLFPSAPAKRIITTQGIMQPMITQPGAKVTFSSPIGPSFIHGDDVWVYGDDHTRLDSDDESRRLLFEVSDWSTFKGALKDVANPANGNPRSDWYFNDVLSWSPWLNMGDQEGNMISRGIGAKVFSFDEMPPEIVALTKKYHPKVYADPRAALGI